MSNCVRICDVNYWIQGDKDYSAIAGQVHDAGDESIAELVTSLSVTIIENETREIRDIEAALGRVQDNSYGICIDCAKPIAPQRLRANPAAKRCIACQERHEDRRGGKDATPSL